MNKRQLNTLMALGIVAGLGATALMPAGDAYGQAADAKSLSKAKKSKQPVNIEADSMEVLDKKKQAIFTGKVHAKRDDVTLTADKLVVDYVDTVGADKKKKTEVTFLNATGHVVIITAKQRITGSWAKMDVKGDLLTVGGRVVVRQDKTVLKGKKLVVNLKTNRSQMTGGRVKGTFVPQ